MEKKITKKILKNVAECMSESIDAVEVMRVSEAIGITADAIYAVPGDVLVRPRTDGSIAHVAIIAKGM